ncbi:MAG: DUF1080 domain-containing protein [Thermoguttaceae bacterium]|jgi:hypothetical protein|nr:DUF1080 domain-containing protein [Thermoguttaceae bacterium]
MAIAITRRFFLAQAAAAYALTRNGLAATGIPGADSNRLVLLADTHVTPKPDISWQRDGLSRCVREILALSPRPANVILFGDLAYLEGRPEEYVLLKELLSPLDAAGIRWHPIMGNHDRRTPFYAAFPERKAETPVADRVVSVVETPRVDFILLDSCLAPSDAAGEPGPVQGGIDDVQAAWLRETLSDYKKPVFIGAHHPIQETQIGPLLTATPAVAGYIHGHEHAWRTHGKDPAVPTLCLPSTGHWGDIGYVVLDLAECEALFTLVQHDYYTPRPAATPEAVKPEWKARVAQNDGQTWKTSLSTADEGFTPLFNGTDLTGWVPCNIAPESFTVRDGLLVTTGRPIGTLRTEKMFENFVIDFEWRHLKSGGNSGLFIWADGLPTTGSAFSRGIEIQVLDLGYNAKGKNEWYTTHGDIFPVNGAKLTLAGRISPGGSRSFPMEERTKPSPEWNHYRLVANNGDLSLSINGKEVTIARNASPRKGYLMLESEGSECHFRNIRIKELPSTGAKPDETADAADGFLPIFTGLDLRGWLPDSDAWQVAAECIAGAGDRAPLWSEKAYAAFDLVADVRPKAVVSDEPQGILLRDAQGKVTPCPTPALEAGKWTRLRVSVKPGDARHGRGPWQIGLSGAGGDASWRNLFLREL